MQHENKSEATLLAHWQQQFEAFWQDRPQPDSSHDIFHFRRVWRTALQIMNEESRCANRLVVMAACYFHDLVTLPKNHPERHLSSQLAADETAHLLQTMNFPAELIDGVCHAVLAHSYSGGYACETYEAEIVQDADRMESLGAIGLARVFYTAGKLQSEMFDAHDPFAKERDLDDRAYAVDHFPLKLLTIADTMNTDAGKRIAKAATDYLRDYLQRLDEELMGHYR